MMSSPREMCNKCMRPLKACFCESIKPFDTNVEFRILMHPKEAKYSHVGTGRLSNIILNNCQIIVDATFDKNLEVQKLLESNEYFPMILYPGVNAHNINRKPLNWDDFSGKKPLIFILDGTWPCAKSMMRDSKTLHTIKRISFDSNIESKFIIRQQPAKYCLSTIESIYELLTCFEKHGLEKLDEKKEVLIDSLKKLVDFQKKCALDPNLKSAYRRKGAYKDATERIPSRKWIDRKICFEDENYSVQK